MDHWDSNSKLRAPRTDPLRNWADLEGKSPTMSEDLYRENTPSAPTPLGALISIATGMKLVTGIVHAWLSDSR